MHIAAFRADHADGRVFVLEKRRATSLELPASFVKGITAADRAGKGFAEQLELYRFLRHGALPFMNSKHSNP